MEQVVEAVRSNRMSYRGASHVFGVSAGSIPKRLNGTVRIDSRVSPGTVLTPEEENCLEENLKWAARRQLGIDRGDLIRAVAAICSDSRVVPRDRAKDPGQR